MEIGQDDRSPRAGRRIIGEVAGQEINLEIEGVQDKKKWSVSHFQERNKTCLFSSAAQ